jgi:N4-(beta-N-acetylglucosaminyl)-L-asparaginase
MFVDNEVGAAGSVGRGEAVIQSAGAFQVVRNMAAGMEPEAACIEVLKWIVRHTKRPALLTAPGEPNFGCVMYALRRDGVAGAASMRGRPNFFLHDGTQRRSVRSATLAR